MNVPRIWQYLAASLMLVASLASGCGSTPRKGKITGTVRFENKALPSGTVRFLCGNGEAKSTAIGPNGMYQMNDVAVGRVRIVVNSHPRVPDGFNPGQTSDGKAVVIPARYSDPEASGLTYDVQEGPQTHDITLEP